jgi:serine/threonine-protein kinase
MGVVCLAKDRMTGQLCAVKTIRREVASDASAVPHLNGEIETLRRVSHPNVVRLLDFGTELGRVPYLAMEYLAGETLEDVVRGNGPLDCRRVVEILRSLCAALAAVHAQRIVHGDIKPANVMVAACGSEDGTIKLIDFGLARSLDGSGQGQANSAGCAFAGSPLFASPETTTGHVDYRSDVYSLGATAYYLLTGRPVFDEAGPLAAIVAHASRWPVAVNSIRTDVPALLDAIIMKCLNKDPKARFQSMGELDEALAKLESSCR